MVGSQESSFALIPPLRRQTGRQLNLKAGKHPSSIGRETGTFILTSCLISSCPQVLDIKCKQENLVDHPRTHAALCDSKDHPIHPFLFWVPQLQGASLSIPLHPSTLTSFLTPHISGP